MNITKHELNYAIAYLPNGHVLKEGYLTTWEFEAYSPIVYVKFSDGFVLKTSVNNVFILHKDVE